MSLLFIDLLLQAKIPTTQSELPAATQQAQADPAILEPPLIQGILADSPEIVREAMRLGANVTTPVINQPEQITSLRNSMRRLGADVIPEQISALQIAAIFAKDNVLEYLINQPNVEVDSNILFLYAIGGNNSDIIEEILAKHPNVKLNGRNAQGDTALMTAIRVPNSDAVKAFLSIEGIDMRGRNEQGNVIDLVPKGIFNLSITHPEFAEQADIYSEIYYLIDDKNEELGINTETAQPTSTEAEQQ